MKKRILIAILSALLIANTTACNSTSDHENSDSDELSLNSTSNHENSDSDDLYSEDETENSDQMLTVDFHTYDSIISTYRKVVELCPRYEEVDEDEYFIFTDETARDLYEKIFSSTLALYPHNASGPNVSGINGNCYERFGYTIQDLNNDGVDELILRLDDHQVIAIFSMVNDSPVLLDSYWNRNRCWIDPDGYLHVEGSSGADRSVTQIYRIADQTGELILLEEHGTDGHDETTGETFWYKLIDNEKVHITREEYNAWVDGLPYAKFEVTKNISEYLNFTPLFSEDHPAPEPYIPPAKG